MTPEERKEIYNRYRQRSQNLRGWLKSGKHLPEFLGTNDGKVDRVFRLIHRLYPYKEESEFYEISSTKAEIYTIDKFLWFMAQCGYTLQRNRSNQEFQDLTELIQLIEDIEGEELHQNLEQIGFLKPSEG